MPTAQLEPCFVINLQWAVGNTRNEEGVTYSVGVDCEATEPARPDVALERPLSLLAARGSLLHPPHRSPQPQLYVALKIDCRDPAAAQRGLAAPGVTHGDVL